MVCSIAAPQVAEGCAMLPMEANPVERCMAPTSGCIVCGSHTCSTHKFPTLRLRCRMCLSFQHLECADNSFSSLLDQLVEKKKNGISSASQWWQDVCITTVFEYFSKVGADFTCASCAALAKARAASNHHEVDSQFISGRLEAILHDIQLKRLFAKIYKSRLKPLQCKFVASRKRLVVLFMCRVILQQAVRSFRTVQTLFAVGKDLITKKFAASRKLVGKDKISESFMPVWLWYRSQRFADVMQPKECGKTLAEGAFLQELNTLVDHVCRLPADTIVTNVSFITDKSNYQRIIQLTALGAAFVYSMQRLLSFCSIGESHYNLIAAMQDVLMMSTENSREYFHECWKFHEVEKVALGENYGLSAAVDSPSDDFVTVCLQSEDTPLCFSGDSRTSTSSRCGSSEECVPSVPPTEAPAGSGHSGESTPYATIIPANVDQSAVKKSSNSAITNAYISHFLKRLTGIKAQSTKPVKKVASVASSELKSESITCGEAAPNACEDGAVREIGASDAAIGAGVAVSVPSEYIDAAFPSESVEANGIEVEVVDVSGMVPVEKGPQNIWSHALRSYATSLWKVFEVGYNDDCPEGLPLIYYLASMLGCDEIEIISELGLPVSSICQLYKKDLTVDIKPISLAMQAMREGCFLELKNLSRKTHPPVRDILSGVAQVTPFAGASDRAELEMFTELRRHYMRENRRLNSEATEINLHTKVMQEAKLHW